jgi:hypothetical protein
MVRLQPGASGPGTRAWRAGSATHQDLFLVPEVEALIAEAKSERKKTQGLVTKRILTLAPYNANLE